MTTVDAQIPAAECFRCGYDLRGIADDQPCPECGLLAARSRRASDELHLSRPKWLTSLSRGVNLILLAIILAFVWPGFSNTLFERSSRWIWPNPSIVDFRQRIDFVLGGFSLIAFVNLIGVFYLTSPEGYPPADRSDRIRRILLRAGAVIPLLAFTLQ